VAIHAEQNLVMDTTPDDRRGGRIYITDEPCDGCLRMLQGSGVQIVIWPTGYWIEDEPNVWTRYELEGSL
jgi:dCMP deaminase